GYGDDTITLENDFGNDTIEMEDQDEVNGDILDMSAVTDDLTVDLSPTNRGAGTVSDGTSTANFQGVEHLVLGSGTNTLVLADFSGTDRVEGFDAPVLNTDGSYSGKDLLDVSGLTDDAGNPVDVNDVVVSDDGAGNAVLSFPHGEALTLVGVAPADVSDVAQLAAMGIPAADAGGTAGDTGGGAGDTGGGSGAPDGSTTALNGIVEGGADSELIDANFTGDPEGDRIDHNDAADGSNDDVVTAGAGNDTVLAGDGNDYIDGGSGHDQLEGGDG
ncbi:calcium-binding protein, partial [Thalassovita mangrovi]